MKDSTKTPAAKKNHFPGFKLSGSNEGTNTCKINANKFPMKLMQLLSSPQAESYKHIITWLPDGKSFKVLKPKEFSAKVLHDSKPFKTFRRQACRWGFRTKSCTIYGSSDIDDYYDEATTFTHKHGLFQKGRYDLLDSMKTTEPPCKQKQKAEKVAAQALEALAQASIKNGGSTSKKQLVDIIPSVSESRSPALPPTRLPGLPSSHTPKFPSSSSSTPTPRMPVIHPGPSKITGGGATGTGPSALGQSTGVPGGFEDQMTLKSIIGQQMAMQRRAKRGILDSELPPTTAAEMLHYQRKQLWGNLTSADTTCAAIAASDAVIPPEAIKVHAAARKALMMNRGNNSSIGLSPRPASNEEQELVQMRKEISELKKKLEDAIHEKDVLLKQRDLFIRDSTQANTLKDNRLENQYNEISKLKSDIIDLKLELQSDSNHYSKLQEAKKNLAKVTKERDFLVQRSVNALDSSDAAVQVLRTQLGMSQSKLEEISKEAGYYKRLYGDSVSESVKMKLCFENASKEADQYKRMYEDLVSQAALGSSGAGAKMPLALSDMHRPGRLPNLNVPPHPRSREPVPSVTSSSIPGTIAGNPLRGNTNATRALLNLSFR